MNRNILAIIVLLALAGLTFVQFRLLVIGARLEKQRFDERILKAQHQIRNALNEPNPVSDALIHNLKDDNRPKQVPADLADSLHAFINNELAQSDIAVQYSFAITSRYNTKVIDFHSNNFKKGEFHFFEYTVPLGNYFSSQIFREKTLHIDIENLFTYLLAELDYLIIPSILCLLALLICLWLLINILQKEHNLNVVKNDFINNLTHELKTPIFSISLSNKMAKDHLKKGNADKVSEFLQIIENENNKLKTHAEKVLELASLENPKHQLQKENTDLHVLIKEVVNDFLPKIKNKKGELKINLNANDFKLNTDKNHIKNVIYNLLDNAIKYGREKPIITIISKNKKRYFLLKIKDNGPGIAAANQKYIFDKFYRVSSNNANHIKGFGLGLNYVKQVVEAHGGKVGVESKMGEGAVFIISLPI